MSKFLDLAADDPCEGGHDFETVEAVSDYQDPGSPSGHGQTAKTVSICSRCGEEDSPNL